MGSVGYREVKAFLEGEVPEAELAQRIVQKTRIFVRRQRTWLRDLELTEVDLDD
jgi:tRNA dimethylallyltransferase